MVAHAVQVLGSFLRMVPPFNASVGDLMGIGCVCCANNVFENNGLMRSKRTYTSGNVLSINDTFIGDIGLGLSNLRVYNTPPYQFMKHGRQDNSIDDVIQSACVNP